MQQMIRQTIDCNAQLAVACLYSHPFCRRAIVTCKVGHSDLVFGVQSGFIDGFVHARLQVSVCNG